MTAEAVLDIGEAFVGDGVNAAHVNTMLGPRSGPVGTAWATALATPSAGHAPFMCVIGPGIPVEPPTLFVNKAAIASGGHGRLTWGAAQAGVALGATSYMRHPRWSDGAVALSDGRPHTYDSLALICAVWVDPGADDEERVFANNATAVERALEVGSGLRTVDWPAGLVPSNPFFRSGSPG